MADEAKPVSAQAKATSPVATAPHPADEPHYEEVSEYRIGEGPPPLFLILLFIFVVLWAFFSWIPFFNY